MSARSKLDSALQAIDSSETVLKRLKNSTTDDELHSQLRKAMRELDDARQYIERARREVRDLER
jgi:hypothetical protein